MFLTSLLTATIQKKYQNAIFRASTLEELEYVIKSGKVGVAVINYGKTKSDFLTVASRFGGAWDTPAFGKIRDLKVTQTLNGSVGSSQSFHPYHQDGVYSEKQVSWIALQCVKNQGKGGQGIFIDLRPMFELMPKQYLTFLQNEEFVYERIREDGYTKDSYIGPLIVERDDGLGYGIRYRYDYKIRPKLSSPIKGSCHGLFNESLAWIGNYLQVTSPMKITYLPGDVIIVNNQYFVHGRTQILFSKRHFRRLWLMPETVF